MTMNREIKFRIKSTTGDRSLWYFIDLSEMIKGNERTAWELMDIGTLCEYTGLKDKNGVEIWEGDIVKCSQKGAEQTGVITLEYGMWNWEYKKGKISWAYECVKKWKGEVIGNIHQKPRTAITSQHLPS